MDSRKTTRNTFDLALELDPDYASFHLAVPYPGTKLYQKAESLGVIFDREWSKLEYSYSVMRNGEVDADTVMQIRSDAYKRFHLRPHLLIRQAKYSTSPRAFWRMAWKGVKFMRWALNPKSANRGS